MTPTTLDTLHDRLRGDVIDPTDHRYDDARGLYNGMIDRRPRLIARCADVADVMTALGYARERGLLVAVRGGGHNGAGLASCDDGLVIDLSGMKGVWVDPAQGTVRAEAGCTQGDLDHATHPFGLAVPAGIVSTTGIAGLTLGGGHGYLSRRYGLTIDHLIEADVVCRFNGGSRYSSERPIRPSTSGSPRNANSVRPVGCRCGLSAWPNTIVLP